MLLEKLVEYAELELAKGLPPSGYELQPIAYVIQLDDEGTYRGPILPTATKDSPNGQEWEAPRVKRAGKVNRPQLLADNGEYVLGVARGTSDPTLVPERHRAFVELVTACAEETGEPSVRAVATFLQQGMDAIPESDVAAVDPSRNYTFVVGSGIRPIDKPVVKLWWAVHQAPSEEAIQSNTDECIVCGCQGPVLERHPLKIRGIPGGQPGKDLISANSKAFESYGLTASRTAPTCPPCAEKYGRALNALLENKSTSIRVAETAFAFWVQSNSSSNSFDPSDAFAPKELMAEPEAHSAEVRELMKSVFSGKTDGLSVDPRHFYAVALGASGARVVVKDWIDVTVGEAKRSIGRFFVMQEIVNWDGRESVFLSIRALAMSTVRKRKGKGKKEESPPAYVGESLVRFAFSGTPLPLTLLLVAVRRNRADQEVTRPRAALIKMVLGSQGIIPMEEPGVMTGLDSTNHSPAYLCGRLLETLGQIQYAALGETNTTVVSRYYGSASSAPQLVFPPLVKLATTGHLPKIERDKPAGFPRLSRQLNEIMWKLDGSFPGLLSIEDQGRFALGFYHQRAQRQHDIDAARTKREADKAAAKVGDASLGR